MNILYAIQGTGNGHFSRAREFIPYIRQKGNLEILVSGSSVDVELGHPVKYNKTGISYIFGKNGGINYLDTLQKLRPIDFIEDLMSFDIRKYDLIINDFEPVTAWAAKRARLPCVGLSHQSAFLSKKSPRPDHSNLPAEWLFKYYAPCTIPVGFHYLQYDDFIFTPVIRSEIRALKPVKKSHITVYLPAYADERLIPFFHRFPSIRWHIFSKHSKKAYTNENVFVRPVSNSDFLLSLESCLGVISGGGFEAPAESLFLGKKLLVIPMFDQYEQLCNAEALRRLGVPVVEGIDHLFTEKLENWLDSKLDIELYFPHHSSKIVDLITEKATQLI